MTNSKPLFECGKLIPTVECLILYQDKVLLLKRSLTSSKFPGFYIGPGGHVDENEDYVTAAIREVYEETDVKVNSKSIIK